MPRYGELTQPREQLVVGHEGEGSVLSQLKAEGLAESLAAGSGLAWRGGSLFGVTVTLTEKGVSEYDRVLHTVAKRSAIFTAKSIFSK